MRAVREERLHNNGLIESRKFRVLTADVENIYLTESEIHAIADLNLSNDKHKEIGRDVFLVSCYTTRRFSDYSTINKSNIHTLENGQQVIDPK